MACARCHRPILKAVMVNGKGYGKDCAALVGDLLTQPRRRATTGRRAKRKDARQAPLFSEVTA